MGEFEIIDKHFAREVHRNDVVLGVGDDAALVDVGAGHCMVCAMATAGDVAMDDSAAPGFARELFRTACDRLAARGAAPAWFTLSLSLPEPRDAWLEGFSRALNEAVSGHGAALVGGDTTRGPLVATLVAHGAVPVDTL